MHKDQGLVSFCSEFFLLFFSHKYIFFFKVCFLFCFLTLSHVISQWIKKTSCKTWSRSSPALLLSYPSSGSKNKATCKNTRLHNKRNCGIAQQASAKGRQTKVLIVLIAHNTVFIHCDSSRDFFLSHQRCFIFRDKKNCMWDVRETRF